MKTKTPQTMTGVEGGRLYAHKDWAYDDFMRQVKGLYDKMVGEGYTNIAVRPYSDEYSTDDSREYYHGVTLRGNRLQTQSEFEAEQLYLKRSRMERARAFLKNKEYFENTDEGKLILEECVEKDK